MSNIIPKMAGHTFILAFMVGVVSSRVSSAGDVAQGNMDESTDDAACVELKNLKREELLLKTPGDVYLTLERRNLMNEYRDLTGALYGAKKGTLGVWKCSELYRSMYINDYDRTFMAKNVSIYLTRAGKTLGSKIQVCFVDRERQPGYVPPNVYTDGKVLKFKKGEGCGESTGHKPGPCDKLGILPEGVYGQVYDNFPTLRADKTGLPVDLMRFLERKGAMRENVDMAAMINTGDKTGFTAAKIVEDFKPRFKAKGIRIFYAQLDLPYVIPEGLFSSEKAGVEWHHWLEYADMGVVGADYRPTVQGEEVEYPGKPLRMYKICMEGDAKLFGAALALETGQKRWGGCGDVAGATAREKAAYPECKCKSEDDKVFCGETKVASRKFNMDSVLSIAGCDKRRAYCSLKPCRPPSRSGHRV